MNDFRRSTTTIREYRSAQQVEANCIAIEFINKGTDTVYVNDLPLSTNQSQSIAPPDGYIDRSKYEIRFENGVGLTQSLFVVRILPKQYE